MPKLYALRNSKKREAYYGDNGLFDVLGFYGARNSTFGLCTL